MLTFDQRTIDNSGVFLKGELERMDQAINLPLVQYTYSRDIQMREDVTIADEMATWTNTQFAAAGSVNPNGKNWVSGNATALAGISVNIERDGHPLTLWGMELGWTIIELNAAREVGRPIDSQKHDGMILKWNMDADEQVYVGDDSLNLQGLFNQKSVKPSNARKPWAQSTPDEIRESINQLLSEAWAKSAYYYSRSPHCVMIAIFFLPHPKGGALWPHLSISGNRRFCGLIPV